jgi:sugar phosphate isomerase/epimerase
MDLDADKIGLSMLHCLGRPFREMLSMIPKAETKLVEVVDEGLHELDRRRALALEETAKSYDLEFTVHAPFAGINIASPSSLVLNATIKRLRQSITNANMLSCKLWLFHPAMKTGTSMFYPGNDWIKNMENVHSLAELACDLGVKIAIENVMDPFVLRNVEDFQRFYEETQDDIGLVLDTGHANITGGVSSFLKVFQKRIVHLHVHDNHGKIDEHLGIGYGSIDWKEFALEAKKIHPDPTVIVEAVDQVKESLETIRTLLC